MIKGNLFGKLLKQLFSILLISCFILLGNSFTSAGYTRQLNIYGYNPYNQSFDIQLNRSGLPLTISLGYTKSLFFFIDNGTYGTKGFWWWYNGLPYIVHREGNYNFNAQGNITFYSVCNEIIDIESTSSPGNCTTVNVSSDTSQILGNFVSSLTSSDYYFFDRGGSNWDNYITFCISNHSVGSSFCFGDNMQSSRLTGSLGLDLNSISFDNIDSSILQNPPSSNGDGGGFVDTDNGGIELDSDDSAINYFESNYGWDSSICYVGVDSLDYLWGSSVSFQQGSGLSIFQAFSGLYGNTDLNKVYVWLNSRLINYEQWFTRDEPLYLSTYNSGTNQVDLYYDNLTFPFAGKPVAFYFMSDYIYGKSPYRSMGSEVVSYCNIKINDGDYNEILDDSTKNNINIYTQQHNKSKGLNYDGSKKVFKNGFVVDYSSGSIGSYTGYTWEDFQHSGNVNPTNFFEFATSEMKSAMNNMQNPLTGVLPSYIIYGLLFFAFFKLLRK